MSGGEGKGKGSNLIRHKATKNFCFKAKTQFLFKKSRFLMGFEGVRAVPTRKLPAMGMPLFIALQTLFIKWRSTFKQSRHKII